MQNGHDKQPGTMQVNPVQAAQYALMFMDTVAHTRAQREPYDMAVAMLQAIAAGQVVLTSPTPEVKPQVEPRHEN